MPTIVNIRKPIKKQVNKAMAAIRVEPVCFKIRIDHQLYIKTIKEPGLTNTITICGIDGNQLRSQPNLTVKAMSKKVKTVENSRDFPVILFPSEPENHTPKWLFSRSR